MTEAGADIVVCHMGLTTGGAIGAETALTLDDCVAAHQRLGRGGPRGAQGRDRALPRRPDRAAGGRALHPRRTARDATASTAPRAWSGCRPRWRSPRRPQVHQIGKMTRRGSDRHRNAQPGDGAAMTGAQFGSLYPRPGRRRDRRRHRRLAAPLALPALLARSAPSCAPASAARRW